jgi:hypothetical protein
MEINEIFASGAPAATIELRRSFNDPDKIK